MNGLIRETVAAVRLAGLSWSYRAANDSLDVPGRRMAGLWWWHHGFDGRGFVAGTAVTLLVCGASPWRLVEAAALAAAVLAVSSVAALIHAIVGFQTQAGLPGCPLCPDGEDPDDGDPTEVPDAPRDADAVTEPRPVDVADLWAEFETQVSRFPAPREAQEDER